MYTLCQSVPIGFAIPWVVSTFALESGERFGSLNSTVQRTSRNALQHCNISVHRACLLAVFNSCPCTSSHGFSNTGIFEETSTVFSGPFVCYFVLDDLIYLKSYFSYYAHYLAIAFYYPSESNWWSRLRCEEHRHRSQGWFAPHVSNFSFAYEASVFAL